MKRSETINDSRKAKHLDGDGEVVKFEEQGLPALDVWLENETIWLTQAQMAKLFGCAPQNITYHLKQIFAIGELEEAPTCKEILQVQIEGTRSISRKQKFYNLDAIISVGYRVNSILGVKFRQWATAVLKEYLLRGSVRDRRLGKLEKRMDAAERAIDTIIYTLTPTLPENRRRIGFGADEAPTKPYGKGGR
ncbi:MAG: virulence RhuM family protein [Kiritimatiellae bacterium]|nr:virulence RhuM family protein [Kiritimatiellia bacterium]